LLNYLVSERTKTRGKRRKGRGDKKKKKKKTKKEGGQKIES
jgi:hypothetical protein